MKRLIFLIITLVLIAGISFAGDFSGETRVDVERDMVTESNIYAIDAGAVYEAGFLKIGADVFMDSEEDLDIGIPVTITFGPLEVKAEPGVDNLRIDSVYVFDGDITYNFGVMELSYGFGYGTDEILDMSAGLTISDLIPNLVFTVEWYDADNVKEDILGIVEAGVTLTY